VSAQVHSTQEPLVDAQALTAYLATLPDIASSLPIRAIERIGRGQSNLTFRLKLSDRDIILRRPPPGPLPPKAHDVLREHRVMNSLAGSAVPVPSMLSSSQDLAVLGVPFFLMEALPGDAFRFALPPAFEGKPDAPGLIANQMVDALAALHSTDPAAVGLDTLSRPVGYMARQVTLWQGQLDYAQVRPVPDLDWISTWLEEHLPDNVEPPSIVHGDYKLDNLIFSQDYPPRLLAIVDWEMAALGDPLADLGWLLAFWCEKGTPPRQLSILPRLTEQPAFPRRHELVDRYAKRTKRSLPDLRYYIVFSLWKMAVLLEAHWARHVRGTAETFDFAYLEEGGPILAAYIRRVASGRGKDSDAFQP
jgi:aminoglycoside phosphotransferase (APT) family kinase protein